MGIYRLSNGVVSGAEAVACAVLSAESKWAGNPLRTADITRVALTLGCQSKRTVLLLLFAVAPLSIFGAAKNRSTMQLPGYAAVRVHYGRDEQDDHVCSH